MEIMSLKEAIEIYGIDYLSSKIKVNKNTILLYSNDIKSHGYSRIVKYFRDLGIIIVTKAQLDLYQIIEDSIGLQEFKMDIEAMYITYDDYLKFASGELEAGNAFLFNMYYLFQVKYKVDIKFTSLLKAFPFLATDLWITNLTEMERKKWASIYDFPDFYTSLTKLVKRSMSMSILRGI